MKSETLPPPDALPAETGPAEDPHWYKDAVIYELHIKAFADSTGDGIGDFRGLIEKLDYVRDLGVNTIWLLPFYPSPFRDDGYDVADFLAVHPAYGQTDDVARLVQEAHRRGLRVITELVLNHTSDQHPLFQAARRAPKGSPERDFYVWSDNPKRYAGTRIIFTDTEKSNWTWDEVAGQYFWHRFFSHQPDLNYDNPLVREAVFSIMEFWLDKGVDGFRLDAIPYLIEREGTSNENLRETHEVIKELRRRLDTKYRNKLLLAEANMWPEDVREYFGEDDECHMAYHFPLMPRMYMAIAQEDRHPVVEILQQTPEISPNCQWAIFLRNHDELTLEMVTSKERDYMYSMYAADPRARINLGIRRRLAPLLENDRDRIKLMNSLLLSMPGSPVLYYGDEIGMGDNIFLGDRDGVRTPMQWSNERNGGFSRADPQRLYLPPIQDPVYGYEAVNVEAQLRDASSLLNWTRRMLAVRRSTQVFGRGRITMLHPGNRKILAYLRELGDEAVLCVANISRMAQPVELDLARFKGRVPVEMSGHNAFPSVGELPYLLTLPSYGFYWFRLATDTAPPDWSTQRLPVEDLAVLVLFDGWNSLFRDRVVPWRIAMAIKTMAQFEGDLLPRFLARQRWFAGAVAGRAPQAALPAPVQVADHAVFAHEGREWLLCLLEGSPAAAATPEARWFAPFAVAWEDGEEERLRQLGPAALAKVRMQAQVGVMADAFADEAFCRAVVVALGAGKTLRSSQGTLHFQPTGAFVAVAGSDSETQTPLRPLPQSRGTVLALDDRLLFKAPRRVRPGLSVELEMGRFLTDVARFEHSVPMFGSVEHVAADGTPSLLLLLQAWVPNQGDAWALGVEQLARQLERMAPLEAAGVELADNGGLLARVRLLAQRTAELHAALAQVTGQPAFDPEPVQAADLQHWVQQLRERAAATLDLLRARLQAQPQAQPQPHLQATPQATPEVLPEALPPALRETAQRLLDAGVAGFEPGLARVAALPPRGLKTRVHGGYRLQEVLLVNNDFVIIDFEGDPERPLQERRAKQSPLCDVAGMLRSFDQARQAALALGSPSETEAARRGPLAQAWGEAVRSAFVQGYGQAAVAAGLYADADDFAAARPLLELFEADLAWQQLHEELARLPEGGVALPGALALLAGWLPPGA